VVSSLVAADAIALEPEIGLYSPEVVRKNAERFKWDVMEPSQYVTELLMIVLKGWKRVYPEYLSPESPFMTTFEEGHWGPMQLLKPVVQLEDVESTPRWLTPPVPHCFHDRNIAWF
jgi:hypothetical protein